MLENTEGATENEQSREHWQQDKEK